MSNQIKMESKHLKSHNEQKRKDNDEYGLWKALHKYQSLGLKAKATGLNPHYNNTYSTLEDCIECANKGIEFGLFFTQHCDNIDGNTYLRTVIRHINDTETTSMIYPITCKDINNPQQIKSSLTYAKRTSLQTIFGFGSEMTDDDDGNSASGKSGKPVQQQTNKSTSRGFE